MISSYNRKQILHICSIDFIAIDFIYLPERYSKRSALGVGALVGAPLQILPKRYALLGKCHILCYYYLTLYELRYLNFLKKS